MNQDEFYTLYCTDPAAAKTVQAYLGTGKPEVKQAIIAIIRSIMERLVYTRQGSHLVQEAIRVDSFAKDQFE